MVNNFPFDSQYMGHIERVYQYFNSISPLTVEEFEQVLPYFEIREFRKKQQVVKKGEVDQYFNIILKGLVRKFTIVGKKDVTLQLSIENQLIHSEISFNTQTPSEIIVEAVEPTVFLSMSYHNLQAVYNKFPKMEKLGRLLITAMFIKKDFRDFSHLKKTTRQRFVDYMKLHPDMLQRVPQKYIASYLNIKPETFSRLKHLMRQKNDKV
jgi:signal-transduction protein with cAMP-binding, CBS, and nucleotidyltransferase domain